MQKDDSKLSMWVMLAAVACCDLPLLLLAGGGSFFAFGASLLTNNAFWLVIGLIFALVFVWLLLKRRNRE